MLSTFSRILDFTLMFGLLSLAIAGCGGSSPGGLHTASPAQQVSSGADVLALRDQVVEQASGRTIDPQSLQTYLGGANAEQKALLADGKLTLSEYQGAYLSWVRCMNEAGVAVTPNLELNGMGEYDTDFTTQSEQALEAAQAAAGKCIAEHMSVVARAWSELMAPLVAAVVPASRAWMARCVTDHGLSAAAKPWHSEDPEVVGIYLRCADQMKGEFHIPVSFGMDGDS